MRQETGGCESFEKNVSFVLLDDFSQVTLRLFKPRSQVLLLLSVVINIFLIAFR